MNKCACVNSFLDLSPFNTFPKIHYLGCTSCSPAPNRSLTRPVFSALSLMANVATMGPPPSPKEPRRSGRRSGPSTATSKSPAGSPTSETGPKPKDNPQRSAPSSSNAGRNKRAKIEDVDDAGDENQKTTVNGTSNGRARRKGTNKEVALVSSVVFADPRSFTADASLGDGRGQEEEEEEQGVTRCICQETGAY